MKFLQLPHLLCAVLVSASLFLMTGCTAMDGEEIPEDPIKADTTGPQGMGPYWRPF